MFERINRFNSKSQTWDFTTQEYFEIVNYS
jgi:hypothetical protein